MKATIPRAETPLLAYKSSLAPWLAVSHDSQKRIVAALELLVLEGRDMALDGRSVIVENGTNPQSEPARHSQPGDLIRLVSPEEIAAFAAYRQTMTLIFDDRKIGTPERERAYEVIVEAIRLADQLGTPAVAGKAQQFLLRLPARYPVATIVAGSVLVLIACVALGGGIFAAVPGQGTGANGGVYVINKFTGGAWWCPPGGGCRSL